MGPIVAVTVGPEEADDLAADLASFGVEATARFPAWEALPSQDALPNFSIFGERLEMSGMPQISRADAAHFIVRQLDDRAFVRRVVVCSN